MSRGSIFTHQDDGANVDEVLSQCQKSLESLLGNDLSSPVIQKSLRSLRDTVENLLQQSVQTEGSSGGSSQGWRVRPRSQSEKEEKRARLEKREEILRQLRNRVAAYKSANEGDFQNESVQPQKEGQADDVSFEMRQQSAAHWPVGSIQWARQLLGIELGMNAAEMRRCYLQMVRVCHPDQNQNAPQEAIQMVNAAWEVLRSTESKNGL